MAEGLKLKLTMSEVQALFGAYSRYATQSEVIQTEHEELLLEHSAVMVGRLHELLEKRPKRPSITLSAVEALAFKQTWAKANREGVKLLPLEAESVQSIYSIIYKEHKEAHYVGISNQ
jgi:hypothetical protein